MEVFAHERRNGLEELVKNNKSIAFVSQLQKGSHLKLNDRALAKFLATATNNGQHDLHYLKTILVSIGWNKNDDVFSSAETWEARHTPEDKPFNFEHDETDIIGHITENYIIDDEGHVVADEQSPPQRFHIITNAVLYAHWRDSALKERMASIVQEIAEGKWFVSMEALFEGFDYAIRDVDGSQKVVARNDESSFLTKYLRAYGGDGEYEGKKVGRLLKKITFSGKGLVRNPANPASIIFKDIKPFGGTTASLKEIYKMSDIETLTKQVAELVKERDTLASKLKEVDEKTVKAQLDVLNSDIKVRDEKVVALEKSLADAVTKNTELEKVKAELAKTVSDAKAELETIKVETKKTVRASALKEAGMTDEESKAAVEKYMVLSDELFADFVKLTSQAKMSSEEFKKMIEDKKKKAAEDAKSAEAAKVSASVADALDNADKKDVDLTVAADDSRKQVREDFAKHYEQLFAKSPSPSNNLIEGDFVKWH
jgi:hypothetical protein